MDKAFDLSDATVDYPDYIPFSDRAMTYYMLAIRVRSLMKSECGKPVVFFDDVTGGPMRQIGRDEVAFQSSFEDHLPIGKQPITLTVVDIHKYLQGRWYMERDKAIVKAVKSPFACTGRHVVEVDASID